MIENIIAAVISGIILLVIERRTGWFSERVSFLHRDSNRIEEAEAYTSSVNSTQGLSGSALAEIVQDVTSDLAKVSVIRNSTSDIKSRLSGEDIALIVQHFSSDSTIVDALEVLSPKISRPVSDNSRRKILRKIISSSCKERAAKILSQG